MIDADSQASVADLYDTYVLIEKIETTLGGALPVGATLVVLATQAARLKRGWRIVEDAGGVMVQRKLVEMLDANECDDWLREQLLASLTEVRVNKSKKSACNARAVRRIVVTMLLALLAATSARAQAPVVGVCTDQTGVKHKCTKFVPRVTPGKPESTPLPTWSPHPTNKPLPACGNDKFEKVGISEWRARATIDLGTERVFCFDAPFPQTQFFTFYTINKGNSSCSNLEVTAISPNGTWSVDTGPAPGLTPRSLAGRWQIKMRQPDWGCNVYEFFIVYAAMP